MIHQRKRKIGFCSVKVAKKKENNSQICSPPNNGYLSLLLILKVEKPGTKVEESIH
jgi:hypothetical protein